MNMTYAAAGTAAVAVTDLANSGYLRIYGGSKAANADTATAETILAQFALPADAFGAATNGTVTANAITGVNASNSGTATWARVVAANGTTTLWDGTCGQVGTEDVVLSSATITAGGALSVVSWVVTFPRSA